MELMKIHFVTGKGGVGKSAVAAAMATAFAKTGEKTLLVELGHQSFFKDYLNLEHIGYLPVHYKENLSIALWTGKSCLDEYAHHLLKVEALAKLFLENPVTQSFINVAPALSELALLGKITSQFRKIGPPMDYDRLVVDAYSTGHMKALLRAPLGMSQAIPFGPMNEQSRSILETLKNPEQCQYHVVTLSEDLPVEESFELVDFIKDQTQLVPQMIVNKHLKIPPRDSFADESFNLFLDQKEASQNAATERIRKQVPDVPLLFVDFIFSSRPQKIVEVMSESFNNI